MKEIWKITEALIKDCMKKLAHVGQSEVKLF